MISMSEQNVSQLLKENYTGDSVMEDWVRARVHGRMLRRIHQLAFRLPETFDEADNMKALRVTGTTSEQIASIGIEEVLPDEGDSAIRCTNITVTRSLTGEHALTDLRVDRYITDDIAELHGIESPREVFEPAASDNDLSLFRVMRCVSLAVHTVEGAKTLAYLQEPLPTRDFSQTL